MFVEKVKVKENNVLSLKIILITLRQEIKFNKVESTIQGQLQNRNKLYLNSDKIKKEFKHVIKQCLIFSICQALSLRQEQEHM